MTYNGHPEMGDRLLLGPVELVVRRLGDDGSIREIGLVLDHSLRPTAVGAGQLPGLLRRGMNAIRAFRRPRLCADGDVQNSGSANNERNHRTVPDEG